MMYDLLICNNNVTTIGNGVIHGVKDVQPYSTILLSANCDMLKNLYPHIQ